MPLVGGNEVCIQAVELPMSPTGRGELQIVDHNGKAGIWERYGIMTFVGTSDGRAKSVARVHPAKRRIFEPQATLQSFSF